MSRSNVNDALNHLGAIEGSFQREPLKRVSRMVPTWFDTDWVSVLGSVSFSLDGSLPAFLVIAFVKDGVFCGIIQRKSHRGV